MLQILDCFFSWLLRDRTLVFVCQHCILCWMQNDKNICEGGFEGSAVHLLKYKSWYNSMDNVSDCAAYLACIHGCIQSCHSELLVCVALNPRLQSPFLHSKSAWSTSHFQRPTELWMLHISAYLLQHTCTPFKAFIGFYINSSVPAGL